MPRLRALVVVSISVALLMGCGAAPVRENERAAAAGTATPLPQPTRAPRDCDPAQVAEVPAQITYDCYWVTVPEHHHAPDNNAGFDGDTLRLAVTVLHSPAPDPSPIPVVYIAGGPGGAGGSPNRWSKYPYINERDVIVYDQRGTGASDPDMECPEVEQGVVDMFTTTDPFAVEVAALDKTMAACHARLESSGVDLSAFSSPEMAADLADIRVALGYDLWNLFGISYGSVVAREALRSYPQGINGVVFDSMPGPYGLTASAVAAGADRAFDQLVGACESDLDCALRHRDLGAELTAAVERFDAAPYRATVELGTGNGLTPIALTGSDIYWMLWGLLYYKESYPGLPDMIGKLAAGDASEIAALVPAGIARIQSFSEGVQRSVTCADDAPISALDAERDHAVLANPGRWSEVLVTTGTQGCQAWAGGRSDPAVLDPVHVDRKVLVLSGTFDPITPTPVAEQVADSMGGATFVAIGGLGHSVFDDSPCVSALIVSYLARPGLGLDTSCAAQVPAVNFTTS